MTLLEFIDTTLPLLMNTPTQRLDAKVDEGDVSVYWAGRVLRIDLRVKEVANESNL